MSHTCFYKEEEKLYSFSDVLRALNDTNCKKWFTRKGWNGDGQSITFTWDLLKRGYEPYPMIEFLRKDCSSIPWTPSNTDIFSNDWVCADTTSACISECEKYCKFSFAEALEDMKSNHALYIHRARWNGKNMKVKLQKPDEYSMMTSPYLYIEGEGFRVPYTMPMSDLMADDWVIVRAEVEATNVRNFKFFTPVELIYEETLDMKFIRCDTFDIMGMGETNEEAMDDLADEIGFIRDGYANIDLDILNEGALKFANKYKALVESDSYVEEN